MMNGEAKITGVHRDRLALIYLRQSSMAQVREHTQSDDAPVRAGRGGGAAGLGPPRRAGDRHRPGGIGPVGVASNTQRSAR